MVTMSVGNSKMQNVEDGQNHAGVWRGGDWLSVASMQKKKEGAHSAE